MPVSRKRKYAKCECGKKRLRADKSCVDCRVIDAPRVGCDRAIGALEALGGIGATCEIADALALSHRHTLRLCQQTVLKGLVERLGNYGLNNKTCWQLVSLTSTKKVA